MNPDPGMLNRRHLLATGGMATASAALVVTGCAPGGSAPPAEPAPGSAAPGSAAPTEGGGGPLGPTSEVPVGGGKIYSEQGVVVTQPAAGRFEAFSTTCTHQGCEVRAVTNGTIVCPCHGSRFAVADGSVVEGPATRPLAPRQVTDSGGTLRLA